MDIKKEYGDANHGLSTLKFIKRRKCAATSRDEDFLPPPPLRPMRRWHHSLVPALVYRYRAQTGVLAQIEVPPRTGIPAELPGGLRVPPFRLRFPQSPLQQDRKSTRLNSSH